MISGVLWTIAVLIICFSYCVIVTGILIVAHNLIVALKQKIVLCVRRALRVRRAGGRPRGRHVNEPDPEMTPKSAPNELPASGYILPDRLPKQHPATKPLPQIPQVSQVSVTEPVDPVLLARVLTGLRPPQRGLLTRILTRLKTPQRRHHG